MDHREQTKEMTQKQIVKEIQRAALDTEGLQLSEAAAEQILETIQQNGEALRFLARC